MVNILKDIDKKLFLACYRRELEQICTDKLLARRIIENFYTSFENFNIYLKIIIVFHLMLLFLINFSIYILSVFRNNNNFDLIFKIVQKTPFIKNIHNFIIANLLLHFESHTHVH